jgi:hypothetical protein
VRRTSRSAVEAPSAAAHLGVRRRSGDGAPAAGGVLGRLEVGEAKEAEEAKEARAEPIYLIVALKRAPVRRFEHQLRLPHSPFPSISLVSDWCNIPSVKNRLKP